MLCVHEILHPNLQLSKGYFLYAVRRNNEYKQEIYRIVQFIDLCIAEKNLFDSQLVGQGSSKNFEVTTYYNQELVTY